MPAFLAGGIGQAGLEVTEIDDRGVSKLSKLLSQEDALGVPCYVVTVLTCGCYSHISTVLRMRREREKNSLVTKAVLCLSRLSDMESLHLCGAEPLCWFVSSARSCQV